MKKFDFLETEYHLEKKYLGFTGKGSFTYSGKIKSFSTVVKVNPDWKDCFITIQAQKDNEDIALIDLLKRNEVLKETNITINDNSSFTISYIIPTFTSSNKKRFDEIIEATISILKKNFYNSNVILTEKEEEFSNFENFNYKEKFKSPEEIKIDYDNRKENIFLGILGVIGVALLGILAYILAGIAGYYVWAIPAFLTAMASTVYKRLAGKISIMSSFVIFILLAVSLFIATFLEYAWRLYRIYKEEYIVTFMEVLKEAPQIILEVPDIKSAFTRDLLINGGILVLGFIITFISAYKAEDRFTKIKRIDDNKM